MSWPYLLELFPAPVVKFASVIRVIPRRNGGKSTFATFDTRYGIEYWTEKPACIKLGRSPAPSATVYPAKPVIASGRQ